MVEAALGFGTRARELNISRSTGVRVKKNSSARSRIRTSARFVRADSSTNFAPNSAGKPNGLGVTPDLDSCTPDSSLIEAPS
jgi:hypothetical protein